MRAAGSEKWNWRRLAIEFLSVGYSEDQFWAATPRQVSDHLDAARQRQAREFNGLMTQAWWSGVIAKSVKTPPLKTLLAGPQKRPAKASGWREIKAALEIAFA